MGTWHASKGLSYDLTLTHFQAITMRVRTSSPSTAALRAPFCQRVVRSAITALGASLLSTLALAAPEITSATLSADTGISATDWVTKEAAQVINVTTTATPGASLQFSLDTSTKLTWSPCTGTAGGTAWSCEVAALKEGTNKLHLRFSTNLNGFFDYPYTLDTTPPAAPSTTAQTTYSTTPTLTGTASTDTALLTVTVGGATYQVTPVSGSWSLDLANTTPTSGTLALAPGNRYAVATSAQDLAGNAATDPGTAALTIAKLPTITAVTAAPDTGSSSTDWISNSPSPTVTVTTSEALSSGLSLLYTTDAGTSWLAADNSAGDGITWTFVPTGLVEGPNPIGLRVAAPGTPGTADLSKTYVYDSIPPAATTNPQTTPSTAPTLTGTASSDASLLTVTVGGATYQVTPVSGSWSLDLANATPTSGTLALVPGNNYDVTTTAEDVAGNTAAATATAALAITQASTPSTDKPVATPVPTLTPAALALLAALCAGTAVLLRRRTAQAK